MGIPLYVRIKDNESGSEAPHVVQTSDTAIEFGTRSYNFNRVFTTHIDHEPFCKPNGHSVVAFVGPTGSGKTTCLKHMLDLTLDKWLQREWSEKFISAFEIKDNRQVFDLTANKAARPLKAVSSVKLDSKDEASTVFQSILASRTTAKTATNESSSRSCLVLKLADGLDTITYVDMMGNEKFDKASSNLFANSTMSSLTQFLKSNGSSRSANTIINIIFGDASAKVSVVLALDPHGDPRLIKSSLSNVADVTRGCQVEMSKPSVTLAPAALPHYARPTLSSLSPKRESSLTWTRNKISKPVAKKPTIARKIVNTLSRTLYGRGAEETRLKIEKLEEEKQAMGDHIRELIDSKDRLLSEMAAMDEAKHNLAHELQRSKELAAEGEKETAKRMSELRESLDAAHSTKSELQESITGLQSKVENIQAAYEGALKNNEETSTTMKELQKVGEDMQAKVSNLTSTIEYLQTSERSLNDKVKQLNSELEARQRKIDDLNSKVADLEKGKSAAADQQKSLAEKSAKINHLNARVINQDKLLGEKAETIADLKLQVSSLTTQASKMSSQTDDASEKSAMISDLQAEIGALKKTNEELKIEQTASLEIILKLKQEVQDAKTALANGEASANHKTNVSTLEAQISELKEKLFTTRKDLEERTSSEQSLRSKLTAKRQEVESLKRSRSEEPVDKENQADSAPDPFKKKFTTDQIFVDKSNREPGSDSSSDKKRKKLGNIDNYRSAMLEMSSKKHKKKHKVHKQKLQAQP